AEVFGYDKPVAKPDDALAATPGKSTPPEKANSDTPPREDSKEERLQRLQDMVNRDEVRRMILGGYKVDQYSLGIVAEPAAEQEFAFRLSVKGTENLDRFPRSVTVDGLTIPVIING